MNAIHVEKLCQRFGKVEALSDLTLDIAGGEFVSVLGPSGCGKTTLLRILGGLITPDTGTVMIEGDPVDGPRPNTMIVFQNFRLLPWKSVEDNAAYGLRVRGVGKKEARAQVRPHLQAVGLTGFEASYPYQLSGGMQQRVGLARALAVDPHILLMDEPFGALDAQTRELMQGELLRIWTASPKTVMFVTHSIDEALVLSDRVIVMAPRPGRVIEDVTVPFSRPRDPVELRSLPQFADLRTRMWKLLSGVERDGGEGPGD